MECTEPLLQVRRASSRPRPSMTGSTHQVSAIVAAAVRRIPTLRAVKFTDADLLEFTRTRSISEQVRVFFGRDELLPAALAFDADGVIGSLYNGLAPIGHAVAAASIQGRRAHAFGLHKPFRDIAAAADEHGGMGFVKELMNELGPDAGPCRPPWGPVHGPGREVLETLAQSLRVAVAAQRGQMKE